MPDVRGNFGSMDDAVTFFRAKKNIPTYRWDDLMHGMTAPAFSIAGATQEAFLSDMREAVDAAISKGETLEDFRRRFDEIVTRRGWLMSGSDKADIAGYRAWRTSVIYHTNVRTAYQAGRWETLKHFPFLKYKHNTVLNPREEHKAWDGLIIATNDPWWETHYPPNGWGCRCTTIGVSQARLGTQTPDAAPTPAARDDNVPPEWRFNVGVAAFGRKVDPQLLSAASGGKLVAMDPQLPDRYGRPDQIPLDTPVIPLGPRMTGGEELRDAFRQALGDDVVYLHDPLGTQLRFTQDLIDHWLEDPKRIQGREQYLPLIPEIIRDPFEVWVGFARNEVTGKVYVRRRYVKGLRLGNGKIAGIVLDAVNGEWVSFNLFHGGVSGARKLREGRLLWARK